MTTTIVDQYSDHSFKHLARVIRQHPGNDDLIKTANIEPADLEKLADTAFAWRERRMFRIDTPEHAAVSRLYMEKQAVPRDVVDACDKALAIYGVNVNLAQEKTASVPDSDYLLPHMRRLRVKTAGDVKLASEAIIRNQRTLDTESRAQASVNLIKKAAALNVRVPDSIMKFAGATMCDTRNLRDWLYARSEAAADPQIKTAYEKLAEQAHHMPALSGNREDLIKVAAAIYELDDAADLTRHYDKRLPDPMSTVFNTDKIADDIVDLAGRQVPMETLLSTDPEIFRDVFGEDLAGEFIDESGAIDPEQLKVILPTVPYDLQKTLATQLGA
jgi:hypothetical protein